jgi:hypothetical protein
MREVIIKRRFVPNLYLEFLYLVCCAGNEWNIMIQVRVHNVQTLCNFTFLVRLRVHLQLTTDLSLTEYCRATHIILNAVIIAVTDQDN